MSSGIPGSSSNEPQRHMTQRIVQEFPPLYDELAQVFGLAGKRGVIFSWGHTIYNPYGRMIPPHLIAHEAAHGARQGSSDATIRAWWSRYIDEPRFRLEEEVIGHTAELQWWLKHGNRNERRRALRTVATRLASPLYGPVIGRSAAEAVLRESVKGQP